MAQLGGRCLTLQQRARRPPPITWWASTSSVAICSHLFIGLSMKSVSHLSVQCKIWTVWLPMNMKTALNILITHIKLFQNYQNSHFLKMYFSLTFLWSDYAWKQNSTYRKEIYKSITICIYHLHISDFHSLTIYLMYLIFYLFT